MKKILCCIKLFLFSLASLCGHAEVTFVSESGFVSEHTLVLQGSPTKVYQALTTGINQWWDADHSYSGNAANFSLQARAGGCFCESLDNGGSVEHMRVAYADPGKYLRLLGGLGPLQQMGVDGSMDFNLVAIDDKQTQLNYRYAVSGTVPGGLQAIASAVDQVQLGQLKRLQRFVATTSSTTD